MFINIQIKSGIEEISDINLISTNITSPPTEPININIDYEDLSDDDKLLVDNFKSFMESKVSISTQ